MEEVIISFNHEQGSIARISYFNNRYHIEAKSPTMESWFHVDSFKEACAELIAKYFTVADSLGKINLKTLHDSQKS